MIQNNLLGQFFPCSGWEAEGGCIWKFCFEHGTEELVCDHEIIVG